MPKKQLQKQLMKKIASTIHKKLDTLKNESQFGLAYGQHYLQALLARLKSASGASIMTALNKTEVFL